MELSVEQIVIIIATFVFGAGGSQLLSAAFSKNKNKADIAGKYQEILSGQAQLMKSYVENNNNLLDEIASLKARIVELENYIKEKGV